MNCKFCNGELPEEVTLCPHCGKENLEEVTEQTVEEAVEETVEEAAEEITEEPAKKRKPWKVALIVVAIVALAAVLAGAVMYSMGMFDTDAAESYTVGEAEAIKARDKVVATVGTEELTNSELQVYYWQAFNEFYNYYGYYLDAETLGLDVSKPLDEQYFDEEEGITWQEYFVDSALTTWSRYAALVLLGKEAGFELDADAQAYMESIPAELEALAQSYEYESAEAMIKEDMSPACDLEGYQKFIYTNLYAGLYMDSLGDTLMPTMDEIEAYYEENMETLNSQGIYNDGTTTVSVRHLLVTPESADGATYTEDEWEACRQEAQALYDMWLADGTEEGFAALATEYSEDPGSQSSGGLYTDVYTGQMVAAFDEWCFDESRQYGDSGLVKTQYGYHLMYFIESVNVCHTNITNAIVNERSTEMVNNAVEKWPLETNYNKIVIGETVITE